MVNLISGHDQTDILILAALRDAQPSGQITGIKYYLGAGYEIANSMRQGAWALYTVAEPANHIA